MVFSPLYALSAYLWWGGLFLAWTLAGLWMYGFLFDRAVFEGQGKVHSEAFGPTDLAVAGGCALLFASLTIMGFSSGAAEPVTTIPSNSAMIWGVVLSTLLFSGFVAAIIGGLALRRLPWPEIFGLRRLPLSGVLGNAVLLLPLAFPLIWLAIAGTRIVLVASGHEDNGVQEIVRYLAAPGALSARVVVAISAMVIAPIQEELIFRGYIYGVLRRYAGVSVGILINALLFAGIHLHAPSFGGLFVLAVCLSLAYEWTGSILVPITMHALFNSFTIINLFHGGNV